MSDKQGTPKPQVLHAPERIWLCVGEIDEDTDFAVLARGEDVTWCEAKQESDDIGYVRADVAAQQTEALREQLAAAQAREAELRDATSHCVAVFRSMADRGAYPEELLADSGAVFLGKQGFKFALDALACADTTALQSAITRAREEERARVAAALDEYDEGETKWYPGSPARFVRNLPAEPTAATCQCNLRTRLVGDGCSICNPGRWAELLADQADDKKGGL